LNHVEVLTLYLDVYGLADRWTVEDIFPSLMSMSRAIRPSACAWSILFRRSRLIRVPLFLFRLFSRETWYISKVLLYVAFPRFGIGYIGIFLANIQVQGLEFILWYLIQGSASPFFHFPGGSTPDWLRMGNFHRNPDLFLAAACDKLETSVVNQIQGTLQGLIACTATVLYRMIEGEN
jgi:hypothetical protein